jgi:hypothetical protein
MPDTKPLVRTSGPTDPDTRYKDYKWHGYPQWLKDAATAYRGRAGAPCEYPGQPFLDGWFHDLYRGLFDHEISFVVDGMEHWAPMPYKDVYPNALQFAEDLRIELVSQPKEMWRAMFVYEFRPSVEVQTR